MRESSFKLPSDLPVEWRLLDEVMKSGEVIWMAEYNTACIKALKKLIGPKDIYIQQAKKYLEEHPLFAQRDPSLAEKTATGTVWGIKFLHPEWTYTTATYRSYLPLKQEVANVVSLTLESCGTVLCRTALQDLQTQRVRVSVLTLTLWVWRSCKAVLHNLFSYVLDSLKDKQLKLIIRAMPTCQYLNVLWCGAITAAGLMFLPSTLLTLKTSTLFTVELAKQIGRRCPHLSFLNCMLYIEKGAAAHILKYPKLETLDFGNCEISEQDIEQGLPNLKSFSINGKTFTDKGYELLPSGLQELSLQILLTVESSRIIGNKCKGLKILRAGFATMDALVALVQQYPNIEQLDLSRVPYGEEAATLLCNALAEYCPNLQILYVQQQVEDAFTKVAAKCNKLVRLQLFYRLSDKCLESMECLPNLEYLRITKCGVSDQGFSFFPKKFPNLQELYLTEANLLSEKGMHSIGELSNLRIFSIENSRSYSLQSIKDMATSCTKLRSISMVECTLDDDTVINVLKARPELEFLDVTFTSVDIDNPAIVEIKKQRPNLTVYMYRGY